MPKLAFIAFLVHKKWLGVFWSYGSSLSQWMGVIGTTRKGEHQRNGKLMEYLPREEESETPDGGKKTSLI